MGNQQETHPQRKSITQYIPGYRTFFLDILHDRRTRPLMIYTLVMVTAGATLFHWLEGWSWVDSFYFVVITLTTIGYGDFAPTTPLTKMITIFYGLNGIILLLVLFDTVRQYGGGKFVLLQRIDQT